MTPLRSDPHFHTPGQVARQPYAPGDEFYEMLIHAHHGLTPAQSELLHARLVLLLANHIGELPVLRQAIVAARAGVAPESESSPMTESKP